MATSPRACFSVSLAAGLLVVNLRLIKASQDLRIEENVYRDLVRATKDLNKR